MNQRDFAENLLNLGANERTNLLGENLTYCDAALSRAFQEICCEVWTNEPQKVSKIVSVLLEIVELTNDKEIRAYFEWTRAIEELVNGKLKRCLVWLDKSERTFEKLKKFHAAAATQTSKLYALALLGRYDEAIACGLRARDVFLKNSDIYSAGKIEHNIGNLYWRRDLYRKAEPFLESAHQRFLQINDQRQLAMVENCQAFVHALQNNFREAESIYLQALTRCKENNLTVTEAEIEIGMSNLYLFQGRFDSALKFLELSRRKYDLLEMPNQSAICQLEIADIYLELNLLAEAREFYIRASKNFAEFEMQAELGRCLLNLGKTLFLLNEDDLCLGYLEEAQTIFIAEGNEILTASVKIAQSQLFLCENQTEKAETQAKLALKIFKKGKNLRQHTFAKWLLGEILIRQNKKKSALKAFTETLKSSRNVLPQVEYLSLVSLGKLTDNETYFREAITLIENSRLMLSAEELRTAFPADYDGDGKTDIGVYRGGNWYILKSSNSAVSTHSFGTASDNAVPSALVQ